MKVLLLLPALLYMIVALINIDLLKKWDTVNFLVVDKDIPVIAYTTVFFILYVLITWFILISANIFVDYKRKKQDKEIWKLKSKLLDGQEALLTKIDEHFEKILNSAIEEGNKKIEAYKKENEKVISNFEYKLDGFDKKLEKLKK